MLLNSLTAAVTPIESIFWLLLKKFTFVCHLGKLAVGEGNTRQEDQEGAVFVEVVSTRRTAMEAV